MATKKKTTKRNKVQEKQSFFRFQPSVETVYWLLLLLLVLGLGVWVMQLTIQTQDIYNQIELLNAAYSD